MTLPAPSATESLGPERWPAEGSETVSPLNQLVHYAACAACRTSGWDGGSTTWPEQTLPDLLAARQFLEQRLMTEPAGRCPRCGGEQSLTGVRLFVRSETLEKDLVLDHQGGAFTVYMLDGNGASAPVTANDPRLRAVFQDGICRSALQMAGLGPREARRALGRLDKLLADSPRSPEPWIALAHIRLALNDSPKRIEQTLKRAAKRADGLGFGGLVRLAEGWLRLAEVQIEPAAAQEAARNCLLEAIELRPDASTVRLELGRLLLDSDRLEESERHLTAAMEDPDTSLSAAYLLGRCALRRGAGARARAVFTQLVGSMGPDPHFLRMLAIAQAACGEHEDAADLLDRARRAEPDHAENEEVAEVLENYANED